MLRDVAEALTATLRVSDVVALISTRLLDMVPFADAALFLYDDVLPALRVPARHRHHQESIRAVTSASVERAREGC